MRKVISQSQYVHKIHQLVHLAEINFLVCQKIYRDYLDKNGRHKNTFLVLMANNAFNESLSVLQTLLCSTEKNDLRIRPALEKRIDEEKGSVESVDPAIESQFIAAVEKDYPHLSESTFYGYKNFLLAPNESDHHIGTAMEGIRKSRRATRGIADFDELKAKFEKYGFHKIRHHQIGHKHQDLAEPAGSAELLLQNTYIENLADIIKDLKIKTHLWFDFSFGNPNYAALDSLGVILEEGNGASSPEI
jgi:hypothetical protein